MRDVLHERRDVLYRHFADLEAVIVEPGPVPGGRSGWTTRWEVGTDRIMNALAATSMYGGPAIVVDLDGTATTFDVVNAKGDGVSSSLLAERLRGLEEAGIVTRWRRSTSTPKSSAALHDLGLVPQFDTGTPFEEWTS